ncbi:MAG TPA: hypothetical protein VFP71_03475, partial [Candidatus Angelobacter sp.]|nr:hypothetical protein [Candidatus Angelobacter sp.]
MQKRIWHYLVAAGMLQAGNNYFLLAQSARSVDKNRIKVETQPGANLGEKLASCIRELGPSGGTCDALSISGRQVAKVDPFAGSEGMVKVLLGSVIIETAQPWALPDKVELAGRGPGTVLRLAPGVNSNLIVNAN